MIENEDLIKETFSHLRQCMTETKFRIQHVERLIQRLESHYSHENEILVCETIALQYRKIIELIALSSISANKKMYSQIREEFYKDWNARLIFRDLERVNQRFYPIPIAGLSDPAYDGGPSIIEEHQEGFLSKTLSIQLYEKCSSVLHADNPYQSNTNYKDILYYFNEKLTELKLLLENFWLYTVPADKAFCIWLHLDITPVKDIEIALFEIGNNDSSG